MNSLVHPVCGYVLLQFQCYMPGAFPVCHPLYAAHCIAWHSGASVARHHVAASVAMARRGAAAAVVPSVAWRRVAAFVAMARRCAAAVVVPSVAWCHVAVSVAMARRCAAPAGAPSVAAAALVHVATVAVKSRYGNVAAVRPAGAVACSAR